MIFYDNYPIKTYSDKNIYENLLNKTDLIDLQANNNPINQAEYKIFIENKIFNSLILSADQKVISAFTYLEHLESMIFKLKYQLKKINSNLYSLVEYINMDKIAEIIERDIPDIRLPRYSDIYFLADNIDNKNIIYNIDNSNTNNIIINKINYNQVFNGGSVSSKTADIFVDMALEYWIPNPDDVIYGLNVVGRFNTPLGLAAAIPLTYTNKHKKWFKNIFTIKKADSGCILMIWLKWL